MLRLALATPAVLLLLLAPLATASPVETCAWMPAPPQPACQAFNGDPARLTACATNTAGIVGGWAAAEALWAVLYAQCVLFGPNH